MKMTSTKGRVRARLLTSTLLAGLATVAAPLAITAVATAIPTLASAQDYSSGTLIGTVTDSSGAPVAGATVKVKSLAQGFERELTTGSDGQFRAALIPIGGYSVSINKEGYQPTSDGSVSVRLGGSSSYGFTLSAEGEVGAVVVTASANPQLDFSGSTIGTVVDVETLVKQVPITRNITALTLLAPSAVAGDNAFSAQGITQASIAGSSVGENAFYVNGLNITNFINGIGGALVPFDFYKTVEVKTGGTPAEFGRATGGYINAVTKSGTNTFTMAIHGNYAPNSLRETPPDTFQVANHRSKSMAQDISIEVGGPIIEDHLFFYALYDAPKTETTFAGAAANYYGVTKSNDPIWGVKLDGYLTSRQHVELTWFDTSQELSQNRYAYNGTTDTVGAYTTTVVNKIGGPSYVGRYTGTFTDWLTVSGAYGKTQFDATSTNNLLGQSLVQDSRGTSTVTVSRQTTAAAVSPSRATREFYRGDVDLYFHLLGDHHIRGGYDQEKTTYLNISQRYGGQNWVYQRASASDPNGFAAGQEYAILRTFNGGGAFKGKNQAYYVQDAWDITDRLTLNLGYRRDKFLVMDADGNAFSKFNSEDALRAGFTWDPFGAKQDKVFGFYGRYYLPTASNTAYRAASNNLDVQQYFLPAGGGMTFGALDPVTGKPVAGLGSIVTATTQPAFTALQPCTSLLLARGVVAVPVNTVACQVASKGVSPDPATVSAVGVKSTMADEYMLGYEHRFNPLWKASATLTYRHLLRAADDLLLDGGVVAYCKAKGLVMNNASHTGCADIYTGNFYLIANPGSDVTAILPDALSDGTTQVTLKAADLGFPAPKREYVALELAFERAFDGKWSLQGSYVMSESKGNYEGAVKSDTGQADAGITSDFDTPSFSVGSYGLLPNHHGHQIKLFGAYAVTDDLMFGMNASFISPRHYGCRGNVPSSYADASTAAGYSIPPAWFCGGKVVPRGSAFHGDWINRVDLSARYTVPTKFVPAGNLVLRADVFNIFNAQGVQESYEQGEPRGTILSTPAATYGKPGSGGLNTSSAYQAPRSVRFGFDLSF